MKRIYILMLTMVVLLSGCAGKESVAVPEESQMPEAVQPETSETEAPKETEALNAAEPSQEDVEDGESTETPAVETVEIKKQYLPGSEPVVAPVEYNCETTLEEGITFSLLSEDAEQGGYAQNVILQVNDKTYDLSGEGSCYYGYWMRRPDGRIFLLLCMDWASDDYHTMVVDITGGDIKVCEDYSCAYFTIIPEEYEAVDIHMRIAVLGYRTGDMRCTLTAEGKLENTSDIYTISGKMTIINYELPVVIDGTETVLPIGTEIQLTGTNVTDIVYFTVPQTGQSGEFYLEREEGDVWGIPMIDGRPEYEYFKPEDFDRLIYAG